MADIQCVQERGDTLRPMAVSMTEAAKLIGVSRQGVYTIAERDPSFPAIKVGGRRLVNVNRLQAWLDKQCDGEG